MSRRLHMIIDLMLLACFLHPVITNGQLPECSLNGPVYFLGSGISGSGIYNVYPDQPLVTGVNPALNSLPSLPPGCSGLAAGPNLNSSTPVVTFYTVQNGKYIYYNGSSWINTGHNVGTVNAINPACSGSYIFNFDILTGTVWRYDGTADAVAITTVSSSGCIFDIGVDCSGNFYILKISNPQKLMKYNSSGSLLNTYNVTGAPAVGYGSGLTVSGNEIYYSDTTSRHGTITGNTMNVVTMNNYFQNPDIAASTDMASCPGVIVHTAPVDITICANQLPYYWNGQPYSATGTYSMAFSMLNGCDSIVTLNLSVDQVINGMHESITICAGQLPYNWNGHLYTAAGNYQLAYTGSNGCDSIIELDLTVDPIPPAPVSTSPVNYCKGDAAIALAATGTGTLAWYTTAAGGTGTAIPPVPSTAIPGITNYYVSQQINGCESPRTQVSVEVYGINDFPDKQISFCKDAGANLLSHYNTAGFISNWTLNNAPVLTPGSVSTAGIYQLAVTNSFGCKDTAHVTLVEQSLIGVSAGTNGNAEYNIPFQLSGSGGLIYEWSPAGPLNNAHLQNPVATLTSNTTFYLTVKDDAGCTGIDSIYIKVFKRPGAYMPNAFTPNGDRLNDVFKPTLVGINKLLYFRIFDRYGELIFETQDPSKGWDGTYKGKLQNSGSYVWILKTIDRNGKTRQEDGTIMLIR